MPELGIDPLKPSEITFILKKEGEEEASEISNKERKTLKPLCGSTLMQDMMDERRKLIEAKYKKRTEEEHYLRI